LLAEETYLKFLKGDMANLRHVIQSHKDIDIDGVLGSNGLYGAVSELFAKVGPENLR
jgi:hypothetical protein